MSSDKIVFMHQQISLPSEEGLPLKGGGYNDEMKRLIKAFRLGGVWGVYIAWRNWPDDWLDDNDL